MFQQNSKLSRFFIQERTRLLTSTILFTLINILILTTIIIFSKSTYQWFTYFFLAHCFVIAMFKNTKDILRFINLLSIKKKLTNVELDYYIYMHWVKTKESNRYVVLSLFTIASFFFVTFSILAIIGQETLSSTIGTFNEVVAFTGVFFSIISITIFGIIINIYNINKVIERSSDFEVSSSSKLFENLISKDSHNTYKKLFAIIFCIYTLIGWVLLLIPKTRNLLWK